MAARKKARRENNGLEFSFGIHKFRLAAVAGIAAVDGKLTPGYALSAAEAADDGAMAVGGNGNGVAEPLQEAR